MSMLAPRDIELLAKILGRLGSDHDGEVAAAGAMACRFIRERKLTWGELLRPRSAEPPPLLAPGSAWRRIAMECRDFHEDFGGLSRWETGFLCKIAAYKQKPSEKQLEILRRIAESVGVEA